MLISLMGGINYTVAPSASDITRWYLFLLPVMVITGMTLYQELSPRLYLALYRYGGGGRWYASLFRRCLLPCLIYVAAQYLWLIFYAYICGMRGFTARMWTEWNEYVDLTPYLSWILPLLCAHVLMIVSLQMGLSLWTKNCVYPIFAVITLLIVSAWTGHIASPSSAFYPGNLGMVLRGDLSGTTAAKPLSMVAVQAAAAAIAATAGCYRARNYNTINSMR